MLSLLPFSGCGRDESGGVDTICATTRKPTQDNKNELAVAELSTVLPFSDAIRSFPPTSNKDAASLPRVKPSLNRAPYLSRAASPATTASVTSV
ncbi:hypothetical protein STCU_10240 [Strigomonas culicis]|uniref:Uncharacterized protein n=1 Tax=Strigomonas culicis TaxID=28005 RepID=S9V573_9TRYP|nr:hypothetical protein STCU_10240 [Strigomonas culicis]|eukprot:EPY18030.1 hypothetical protein STCU_10240 [Strigomonas culicis]